MRLVPTLTVLLSTFPAMAGAAADSISTAACATRFIHLSTGVSRVTIPTRLFDRTVKRGTALSAKLGEELKSIVESEHESLGRKLAEVIRALGREKQAIQKQNVLPREVVKYVRDNATPSNRFIAQANDQDTRTFCINEILGLEYEVGIGMRAAYAEELAKNLQPPPSPEKIDKFARALEGFFFSLPPTKTVGTPDLPTPAEVDAIFKAMELPKDSPEATELLRAAGSTPDRGLHWMQRSMHKVDSDECCQDWCITNCPRNLGLRRRYGFGK